MEYAVVLLAAALAGVGTGLVGLSAATAMVPLMIVLCPTFQGEHGAYMATAIALASDILGSAVTTGVYAKNRHLDLRHGWIMLVCIVGMCMAGSVAAFFTHQQVLGGFSLFLCVAIGIRFLVKPDSKKTQLLPETHRLTVKEIAVSLFFGLTIGFGTGYFGSGGGMMMLIVFTAFLGYDRKTAVGTSTFIMTFTALIASVSHMLIEPAIVVEAGPYLALAIVTATVFSLVSAQFANRVNARTVGLITGWVLLTLGLVLVALQYRHVFALAWVAELLRVLGQFTLYLVVVAAALIVVRFTTRVPDYIFRKLLHGVAISCILPLTSLTEVWWISVVVIGVLMAVIFAALAFCERFSFYSRLFVEKGRHEVITSFMLLFGMMGVMIAFCWGVLGADHRYLAVGAIMAWGPGDGMAAIIGHRMGRHKLRGRLIEGVKSVEGTVAMGVTSFLCTLAVLLCMTGMAWYAAMGVAAMVAVVSALTELQRVGYAHGQQQR